MKRLYVAFIFVFTVISVFSANLNIGKVNLAYVLMFHPEMRDFLPEYGRFTANTYKFKGSEEERIEKRKEVMEEKLKERKRKEKELNELYAKMRAKRKELEDVVAAKNKELFELNAKYKSEIKGLSPMEIAKKEKIKEENFKKIVAKYENKIQTLNEEIAELNDKITGYEDDLKAKKLADILNDKNGGGVFLDAKASREKAKRIVNSINEAIKYIANKKRLDMVLNASFYSPLGKIKDNLTFNKIFKDDFHITKGQISDLSLDIQNNIMKKNVKPLHSLLDSDNEQDIVKYYALRYEELESIARPFYIPLISKTIVYGKNYGLKEDITKDVINYLFKKYKVRSFEVKVANKVLNKILED